MADFRKDCYSGSLTLVKECGPVRIDVWPGVQEVDVRLEDPASQYTMAGGGGLDYVIPEQTVTLSGGSSVLHDVTLGEDIPWIITKEDVGSTVYVTYEYYNGSYFDSSETYRITLVDGNWVISGYPQDTSLTISAIRGF